MQNFNIKTEPVLPVNNDRFFINCQNEWEFPKDLNKKSSTLKTIPELDFPHHASPTAIEKTYKCSMNQRDDKQNTAKQIQHWIITLQARNSRLKLTCQKLKSENLKLSKLYPNDILEWMEPKKNKRKREVDNFNNSSIQSGMSDRIKQRIMRLKIENFELKTYFNQLQFQNKIYQLSHQIEETKKKIEAIENLFRQVLVLLNKQELLNLIQN